MEVPTTGMPCCAPLPYRVAPPAILVAHSVSGVGRPKSGPEEEEPDQTRAEDVLPGLRVAEKEEALRAGCAQNSTANSNGKSDTPPSASAVRISSRCAPTSIARKSTTSA